jgi:hypothetical protein
MYGQLIRKRARDDTPPARGCLLAMAIGAAAWVAFGVWAWYTMVGGPQ